MKKFLLVLASVLVLTGAFSTAAADAAVTPVNRSSGTQADQLAPATAVAKDCEFSTTSGSKAFVCQYYNTTPQTNAYGTVIENDRSHFVGTGEVNSAGVVTQTPSGVVPTVQDYTSRVDNSTLLQGVGINNAAALYQPPADAAAATNSCARGQITGIVTFITCLIDHPDAIFAFILIGVLNAIYWIVFTVVWLAASILDYCTSTLVIRMGIFVNSTSAAGIQAAWQIMRDLANIGIIGGLIATAIGTILQVEKYTANKVLARLIIAALLVNFSYFVAGAIVDSSNFLATAIYNDMTTSAVTISGTSCTPVGKCSLSSVFMKITNFQSLHDDMSGSDSKSLVNTGTASASGTQTSTTGTVATAPADANIGPWMEVLVDLLSIVFELVTIFVFLSATALLIGRFVALVFVLITSPIGIAGSAIPGVSKYAKEWWGILFAQAFFAPVYFLLLDFSFRVLSVAKDGILIGGDQPGSTQALGIMLTFIITSSFMLMSLKIAKQMSESGKQYLGDIYKGAQALAGWMPKLYTDRLGNLGAESLGRLSDAALDRYNKAMANQPNSRFGKVMRALVPDKSIKKGLEAISKSKFGGDESFLEARSRRISRRAELDLVRTRKEAEKEMDAALPAAAAARAEYEASVDAGGLRDGGQTKDEVIAEWKKAGIYGTPGHTDADAEKQAEKNRRTREAYKDYMTKRAKVEKALNKLPPESFDRYIERGDWDRLISMGSFLSSADFGRLYNNKNIPKDVRDKMLQARYGNILGYVNEGIALERKMKDGTATDEDRQRYKVLQGALYNEFKRGGIDSKDFEILFTEHPEMLSSEFVIDGGIPSGSYQQTQDSSELGTGQKWLAKETRRVGPKRTISKGDKAYAAGDEEGFEEAVEEMEDRLEGKQPHEVVREYGDAMVTSMTFAAAVGPDAFFALYGKKDPVYLQKMLNNIVSLYKSGKGTPEQRKRWEAIIRGIQAGQTDAALGYQGMLVEADKATQGKGKFNLDGTPVAEGTETSAAAPVEEEKTDGAAPVVEEKTDDNAPPAAPAAPEAVSDLDDGSGPSGEDSGTGGPLTPKAPPPEPDTPPAPDVEPPPANAPEPEPVVEAPDEPEKAAADDNAPYAGQEADRAQGDILAERLSMVAARGGDESVAQAHRPYIKDALSRMTDTRGIIDFAARHPNLVTQPEFIRALTPKQFAALRGWSGLTLAQRREMDRIWYSTDMRETNR